MSAEFDPNGFCSIDDLHHSTVTTPRCTGCGKKNPSFVADEAVARSMSENIKCERHTPDPGRKKFTSIPLNATIVQLPDTSDTSGTFIPKNPSDIRRNIGETGRQESIEKNPNKRATPTHTAAEILRVVVTAVRWYEEDNDRPAQWKQQPRKLSPYDYYLNVRANMLLAVAVAVQNKPATNVAHVLLGFLYDKYKRQQNRGFMCPTEPNSDIPIAGRWILAQSFSLKGGPVELDVEDEDNIFEDTKAFLDCWFNEGRRPNSPYTVWLFFKPDLSSEPLLFGEFDAKNLPIAPRKSVQVKPEPTSNRKTKMEKDAAVKKEPKVRAFPPFPSNLTVFQNPHKRTASKMDSSKNKFDSIAAEIVAEATTSGRVSSPEFVLNLETILKRER
jgi:hypothetical protein